MIAARRPLDETRPGVQSLLPLALPAVTVVLGMQVLRVVIPYIVWYYGVQPGITSIGMGIYAFALFLPVFLAGVLRRLLGLRLLIAVTALGVAITRLWGQLTSAPAPDFGIASAGAVLFVLFLAAYLGYARTGRRAGMAAYGLAVLLGIAIDTALHGATMTYDWNWLPGPAPLAAVLVLVAAQAVGLVWCWRQPIGDASDGPLAPALLLIGWGPFLVLHVIWLQTIGWLTVLTGWPQPAAFGWIVLCNAAALAVAAYGAGQARRAWWPAPIVGALVLLALVTTPLAGVAAAVGWLVGQVVVAAMWIAIMAAVGEHSGKRGLWRTTLAAGLGVIVFLLLAFAFYVSYDIKLPFESSVVLPVAALILALCALAACLLLPRRVTESRSISWQPVLAALALLVFPVLLMISWRTPAPLAGRGFPVRVMTYNVHQGFATDGALDMEGLARTIEAAQADVVGLQEVGRGWYIDGSLDMAPWLARRLNMQYVYTPALDPLFGNAVLTRFPILESGRGDLPRGGAPMKRSYVWTRLDIGGGETLLFTSVHLHHIESEGAIRVPQAQEVVRFWDRRARSVIVGDMNAEPGAPEIAVFRNASLLDAFAQAGQGSGLTFIANDPYQRIDYIWLSPDLQAGNVFSPQSTASDHLPVVATISR